MSTVDSQGDFSSGYHTAVSSAQKPIELSPLVGSQHLDEDGQCTFGFAVSWKNFSWPATGKPPGEPRDTRLGVLPLCQPGTDGLLLPHRISCNVFTRMG